MEEDRLRKEREARERQNDMTLEETRTQITKMEKKLEDLHNQKQQLVLQLKKVLNEDENRKKQQKDNEMYAMQALQAQQATAPQAPVFVPPVRVQHHPMHILTKVHKLLFYFNFLMLFYILSLLTMLRLREAVALRQPNKLITKQQITPSQVNPKMP